MADGETLDQLHKGWPKGVLAALCLAETGDSEAVFLQGHEFEKAAARISQVLGREDSDFVFVPRMGGYPTKKLNFSEEQQLCGILADMTDLPSRARAFLADAEEETPQEDPVAPARDEEFPAVLRSEQRISPKAEKIDEPEDPEVPVQSKEVATPKVEFVSRREKPKPRRRPIKIIRRQPVEEVVQPAIETRPVAPVNEATETSFCGWAMSCRDGIFFTLRLEGAAQDAWPKRSIFTRPIQQGDGGQQLQADLDEALDHRGPPAEIRIPIHTLPRTHDVWSNGAPRRTFVRIDGTKVTLLLPVAANPAPPRKVMRPKLLTSICAAAVAVWMIQIGMSQDALSVMRQPGATYMAAETR